MTNNISQTDKIRRNRNRARKAALYRFTTGIRHTIISPWKNIFVLGYGLLAVLAWCYRGKLLFGLDSDFLLYPIFAIVLDWSVALLLLLGLPCLISVLGTPRKAQETQDSLFAAGFVNHAGEPPLFLTKYKHKRNPHIIVWEFDSNQVDKTKWVDSSNIIGAALLCKVDSVKQKGRRMILNTLPMSAVLPNKIYWNNAYLSKESFVLALGETFTGRATVNLAQTPHILLGGSTGSGKSVLLRLLLMQAKNKGADVYIADFKGGVDFPRVWHEKCRMCFEETELLDLLTGLTEELQCRKTAFSAVECPNIDTYNAKVTNSNLNRIIFACDEVAEVLDKTGLTKERKDLFSQIESQLSLIARQGRAFGIHLILATQRPSADLISGQIRTNLGTRICGYADDILSKIILDTTAAAEQIAEDEKGRFVTNTGELFQSYLFDENEAFSGVQAQSGGVPYGKGQEAGNDHS